MLNELSSIVLLLLASFSGNKQRLTLSCEGQLELLTVSSLSLSLSKFNSSIIEGDWVGKMGGML